MEIKFNKKSITVTTNSNMEYGVTKYTFAKEQDVEEIKAFAKICKPSDEQLLDVIFKACKEITIL